MTADNIVIKAQGLTRRFGKATAVNQLNLSIPARTIYGFLGPNGCGKSTTIRMLTGLLTPSEGSATVQRLELPRQAEQLRQHIGYMTQKFSLYDDLTVLENLTFVSQIYGLNQKALTSRIQEQLSVYSLEKLNRQMAGSLSGGQKQRLALAAATLHKPEILFLDEPTSAVDPENRRDFWKKLFDLCDQGTTIMVSTHYMDEAERCHGLAILENGEKRADGSPEQLMDNMQATVVEIAGENLRSLKNQLLTLPDVISAAQQGVRLRVLVKNTTDNAVVYLQRALPQTLNMAMNITHPSLEDVFVQCTGKMT